MDSFHRAILSYRNTPDPYTKESPAVAIFRRQVCDGLPVLPGHYNPHNTWHELLEHREQAMARRHIAGREEWEAHTKDLAQLVQGDTGKVVECKEYDQYLVKVDGTGRTTLRNRKHLRKFQTIPKHPQTSHHAAWATHHHRHTCHGDAPTRAAYPSPRSHDPSAPGASLHAHAFHDCA